MIPLQGVGVSALLGTFTTPTLILLMFMWVLYQMYNPLWDTKMQSFRHDFTERFQRLEVGQISLAEEVDGVNEQKLASIHNHDDRLSPDDIKTE